MVRVRAIVWAVLVVASLAATTPVWASISNSSATNAQDGDNTGNSSQNGTSKSGDAVGGQVSGVVASGRTSVDANNTSQNSSVETGPANGSNASSSFVGLSRTPNETEVGVADLSFVTIAGRGNIQEGDNRQTATQTSNATTGDGVAGEVIGVVTGVGGSASIVASNTSRDVDVTTGDARAANDASAFVGLGNTDREFEVGAEDISNITIGSGNVEQGSNRQTFSQASNSTSGDGVAGQVIGVVSSGTTSVDARNESANSDVQTGDALAANTSNAAVGQLFHNSGALEVGAADITGVSGFDQLNLQEGANRQTLAQSATATTGDGVAGQVIGAVVSGGGSAAIVATNTSDNVDASTGASRAANSSEALVGMAKGSSSEGVLVGGSDISNVSGGAANVQQGDNRQSLTQMASAVTGDGVAGQVIGDVSGGASSIDATNSSRDSSVQTGDAAASNTSSAAVGLIFGEDGNIVVGTTDITSISSHDHIDAQEGSNRETLTQSASATSGDGVAGEVIGAVTSVGGSAAIVAANTSRNVDVRTGDAEATNVSFAFVGNANVDFNVDIGDISGITTGQPSNIQDGSNRLTLTQTANASTGDGVAGQVLGVVSAGRSSVDARNTSNDVTATSGDSAASNASSAFVGLVFARSGGVSVSDITGVNTSGGNLEDGSNRKSLGQSAAATSGDAVAGQVTGVVTSAGGEASVVLDNTSSSLDSQTGDSTFANADQSFVGLTVASGAVTIG